MTREVIRIPNAPESPYYSQAIKVGNIVHVAGTTGADPATGRYAATVAEQTRQALLNCRAILRAAGAELTDVVDVHQLLLNPEDADAVNEVWLEFFPSDPPARCVSKLGVDRPPILISLKLTAIVGWRRRWWSVAGPYRSGTDDDPTLIAANLRSMNEAALTLFRRGRLAITGEAVSVTLIESAGSRAIGDERFTEIFHPAAQ